MHTIRQQRRMCAEPHVHFQFEQGLKLGQYTYDLYENKKNKPRKARTAKEPAQMGEVINWLSIRSRKGRGLNMLTGVDIKFTELDGVDAFIVTGEYDGDLYRRVIINSKFKDVWVGTKLDMIIPLLEAFDNLPEKQKKWENNFALANNWVYDGTRNKRNLPSVEFEKTTGFCRN